jgi:hypothetical protein
MVMMDALQRSVAGYDGAAFHRPGFRVGEGTSRDASELAYAESVRVLADAWRDAATRAADTERDALVGLAQAMLDAEQRRCAAWRRSVEARENRWKP